MAGGTGFVGLALVDDLIAAGHHVVGLSRSDAGAKLSPWPPAPKCMTDAAEADISKWLD